ncbi:2-deoxy-5-keto-D-gluconate 6-phosphate aldolase domain-containing protein, partial [Klebsiella pneumoniae]|uniref:2-deoxy-5-keto-D-gluconate 6-phosphate aldolase domain-containing protein n=1 Tax=Klebsiella pneumoniae TaxID=573 RepID=UPI003B59667B
DNVERHFLSLLVLFLLLGFMPVWWLLPPLSCACWLLISALFVRVVPWCRGFLILGLVAPSVILRAGFAVAAALPM